MRAVGATVYLCGTGGSRYLDPAPFTALGITAAMFAPPQHAIGLSPENARRASALADLAAAGPERLAAAMRDHARENYATAHPSLHSRNHVWLRFSWSGQAGQASSVECPWLMPGRSRWCAQAGWSRRYSPGSAFAVTTRLPRNPPHGSRGLDR